MTPYDSETPLHYKLCGLDNVYLADGYTVHDIDGEPAWSFEDIDGMHKAIGLGLVKLERPLLGREFRYLRKELDLNQVRVAQHMDVDDQTVGRWEKRQSRIPGSADKLLRMIYIEGVTGKCSVSSCPQWTQGAPRAAGEHFLLTRNDRWQAQTISTAAPE